MDKLNDMTPNKVRYEYRALDPDLAEDLARSAWLGESVLLLGARYAGKVDLLRDVAAHLWNAHRRLAVGPIRLLQPGPITTVERLHECLQAELDQLLNACDGTAASPTSTEATGLGTPAVSPANRDMAGVELLAPLWARQAELGAPVILFLSNVDSLGYTLASQLLSEIGAAVRDARLVVFLSGETELDRVASGSGTPLALHRRVVVQRPSRRHFRELFERYRRTFRCAFADPEYALDTLWRESGETPSLMRSLLWRMLEQKIRQTADPRRRDPAQFPDDSKPLLLTNADLILSDYDRNRIHGLIARDPSIHNHGYIRRAPECWRDLAALVHGEEVQLETPEGPPTRLEFAGLATRDGDRLRLAGGLVQDFAQKHYSDQRLGDMFARVGLWEDAFAAYGRLPRQDRRRPVNLEDAERLEGPLLALDREFAQQAHHGSEALIRLLSRALHLLLGYRRVSLWRLDPQGPTYLKSMTAGGGKRHKDEEIVLQAKDWLQSGTTVDVRPENATGEVLRFVVRLPQVRSCQPQALVVEGEATAGAETAVRTALLKDLARRFDASYRQAIRHEKQGIQIHRQYLLAHSITQAMAVLGKPQVDFQEALRLADQGLLRLGYDRVVIALRDPSNRWVDGVYARGFPDSNWLLEKIHYDTRRPAEEREPLAEVVETGRLRFVPDARSADSRCDREVVQRYGILAVALIPLRNPRGATIGAIQVERRDRGPITGEEASDILWFGEQLAIVIEQWHRANLLQQTLDGLEEPVLITGVLLNLRYANQAAAARLGLPAPGWWWQDEDIPFPTSDRSQVLRTLVERALRSENREVEHHRDATTGRAARYEVLESKQIRSWNGLTSGSWLHITNLEYVGKFLKALEVMARAHDFREATEALLEVARIFGHPFAHLWVLDPVNRDVLVLRLLYLRDDEPTRPPGTPEQTLGGDHQEYGSGRDAEAFAFRDSRNPIVFVCRDPQTSPPGSEYTTERGVRAQVIAPHNPTQPWAKKVGDFWVDCPLWVGERCTAKLTLGCTHDITPEQIELLGALCQFLAGLLATLVEIEYLQEEALRRQEENAERATATMAHDLARKMGAFSWLLADYRSLERGELALSLAELNERFRNRLQETAEAVHRAKRLLRVPNPQCVTADLREVVAEALRETFPDESTTMLDAAEPCFTSFDPDLMRSALLELLDNCRHFTESVSGCRVQAFLGPDPTGDHWELHIRDRGPGVPQEYKPRIFDDFFTHRPGEEEGGTGLGLAHTRRVVRAHGGEVLEVGTPGEGAHFVLRFPRGAEAVEER